MATTVTNNNDYGILINNTASDGYKGTSSFDIDISLITIPVTLGGETNYYIDDTSSPKVPTATVPGSLSATFTAPALGTLERLGYRLTVSSANAKFNYATAANTLNLPTTTTSFAVSEVTPQPLALNTIVTQTVATGSESSVTIPVNINYLLTGTNAAVGDAITFTFEVYVVTVDASEAAQSAVLIGSASQTSTSTPLAVTVYSAELTSALASYSIDGTNNLTSKTAFAVGEKLAIEATLTTTTTANYKKLSTLTFANTLNQSIAVDKIYISTTKLTTLPAADSTTVKILDITSATTTPGDPFTKIASAPNNIITIDMNDTTIVNLPAAFFETNQFIPLFYVYFSATASAVPVV